MASHHEPEEPEHLQHGSVPADPAYLDPAEPPSRPESAMSNESFPPSLYDLSSNEDGGPQDDSIPGHQLTTLVKLRDGGMCLLCGCTEDLVVARVALQGGDHLTRVNVSA